MSDFDPPAVVVRDIVTRMLAEDVGLLGDLTSIATVPESATATGWFRSRSAGVLAGTASATEVFTQVDPTVVVEWQATDGDELDAGTEIATVRGPKRSILAAERSALNLLGHLSGVATLTRRYVNAAHGRTRIRDTRKTLPGLRALQKAAVRAGGGFNHRESLSDAVLIKDNHLVGTEIEVAVERARARWPGRIVEVECDSIDQVRRVAPIRPDLVLLDNMTPDEVRAAIAALDGACPVEVSGGVDLDSIAAYAATGADFVSIGALTHSVSNLDLGLDME